MPKPNAMLAKLEAKIRAELQEEYDTKREVYLQMSMDAAFFAANEVLKMGPGRVKAFYDAYIKNFREMYRLLNEDGKDDEDLVYSTEVIDRRLKKIVGPELFVPWDVRYGD